MKSMNSLRQVLMISKPVVPPWNDSAKNIVRSQVAHGSGYNYRVMTTGEEIDLGGSVINEPLYPDAGSLSGGIKQNFKVMLRGLRPGPVSLYHYFFAPNLITSTAGRVQRLVARVKTVQTICSAPASFEGAKKLIFTDGVIVLSDNTKRLMENAGVPSGKIRHIRPGIEPIEPPSVEIKMATRRKYGLGEGRVVIFPGDLEFSTAAQTVADAAAGILSIGEDVQLVFACRLKTEASRTAQEKIKKQLNLQGDRVVFINLIDNMPAFVGAGDVVVMPSESLYAKMDVPLVLLEALSQEVPIVIADSAPLGELLDTGGALVVPPQDPEALSVKVKEILTNKDMNLSLAKAGSSAVKDKYGAKNMALQIENFYDELLSD